MRRLCLFVLVFVGIAGPAMAQATAEGLLRQEMQKRGIYSGVDYQANAMGAYDPATDQRWNGLTVSQAMATGGGQWTFLAVVRNTSGKPYCIRSRASTDDADPRATVTALEGNRVVEPGAHLVVYVATAPRSQYRHNTSVDVAFWPPNLSAEYSQQCRSVAPAGLDAWSARRDRYSFTGSIR